MQNWVANTILKRKTGVNTASIVAMNIPMKIPPYTTDEFGEVLSSMFALIIIIMYVFPVYRTTYRIVNEKETKVKEAMRMMGLGDAAYWSSWGTYYSIVNTVISVITWAIMTFAIKIKSDSWIVFLTVWLFGQSLFGLMLITQSLFSSSRSAAITCSIVYFGTTIPQYFVKEPDIGLTDRMWASLSPTTAMIQTVNVLAKFEGSQVGLTIDTIDAEFDNFKVIYGLIMLLFDNVWILLLGLYLEQVMPRKFGRRRHPFFCFKPAFWSCCCCCKKQDNQVDIDD